MALVQNSFATGFANGYPGMVANGETSNRIARTVEDAAGISFGKAVFRGAGDHGCTATPAAGKFLGVVIANAGVVPTGASSIVDGHGQNGSAGIMNRGVIWVVAGSNTTAGAPAFVDSSGNITATSTGNTAIGAVFDDTVSSGALVRLRVTP